MASEPITDEMLSAAKRAFDKAKCTVGCEPQCVCMVVALRAALAVQARTHVVVPREPTEAMIEAARGCRGSIMHDVNTRSTWTAMLAASTEDRYDG